MTCFPRDVRMCRKEQFTLALREGARLRSSYFVCHFFSHEEHARLGMIVSRRVGNAVVRNRIKRCVREWFRTSYDDCPNGYWLMRALPPCGRATRAELFRDLTQLHKLVKRRA